MNYDQAVELQQSRKLKLVPSPKKTEDEINKRLVAMINRTNLVALDKTMAAIRRSTFSYAAAAIRVHDMAKCITRAVNEIKHTL